MKQNEQKAQFEQIKTNLEKQKELDILTLKGELDIKLENVKHENKMKELELQKSLIKTI